MSKQVIRNICVALILTLLPIACAWGEQEQHFSMGPFQYALKDGCNIEYQEDDGLFVSYQNGNESVTMICLSIDDALNACECMGCTLDWVKEQFNQKSEFVQPIVGDTDTVYAFYQGDGYSDTLLACVLQDKLLVGYEKWINGTLKPGEELFALMQQMADRLIDQEAEKLNTLSTLYVADPPWNDSSVKQAEILSQTEIGFQFCGLSWNADPKKVLFTIAQMTQRNLDRQENTFSYLGYGKGVQLLGIDFPVCTVTLLPGVNGTHWKVECQLVPGLEQGDASHIWSHEQWLKWFSQFIEDASAKYGEITELSLLVQQQEDGRGETSQFDTVAEWQSTWTEAINCDPYMARLMARYQNMTLYLEKSDLSPYDPDAIGTPLYTCWLDLQPVRETESVTD